MIVELSHNKSVIDSEITLTASKSESNRALIIQALCEDDFKIDNLAIAEDTKILKKLLAEVKSYVKQADTNQQKLSVGLAGTVMRFMTAYLAIQHNAFILTGAQRMKERPIKILVEALRELGADINYLEKEGYPPLSINGKELSSEQVKVDGNVSSQYVSALLMIAPKLNNGLQITFKGEIISKPYIDMTINMMQYFGADVKWSNDAIVVKSGKYKAKDFVVEADWSAASYWYGIVALSENATITLYGLKKESLQGDAAVAAIYTSFGVTTDYIDGGILITKITNFQLPTSILTLDFVNCPDIAQSVAVTAAALNVKTKLTGLKTLRIKETDRIAALQTELNNLGFNVEVDGDDLIVLPSLLRGIKQSSVMNDKITSFHVSLEITNTVIKTYNDHRMAMAFAPLALLGSIKIENPEVVKKSYPKFWDDLVKIGF